MPEYRVALVATEGIFQGLAKQNMLFHSCIAELIDNAIAAQRPDTKFRIDAIFVPGAADATTFDLYLADNCKGMDLKILSKALQLGESATTESRLNEHGFGLKNALATLSGGNGPWKIWSKMANGTTVVSVEGPFRPEMIIRDDDTFPQDDFLPQDISTLVKVSPKVTFLQTVQGRGAPTEDFVRLRDWLIEHLGVLYRGYLEQNSETLDTSGETLDTSGVIVVSINTIRRQVPPVQVPLGDKKIEYIEVTVGGKLWTLEYHYGTLDEVKRDKLIRGSKAKYYYQGNQATQGIDIRLGKRTIAARQFETIWKSEDGKQQLNRHNNFNDFVGELLIPELPRGMLSTINNKTDFNLDDPDWMQIFTRLNDFRPQRNIREKTELELRKKWIAMLKATNPEDVIVDDRSIWPTGTRIDIYRRTPENKIIIYELKVGTGTPIHLYQLKMYWDGLVITTKEQPKEAILLVEDFNNDLEEMANMMNQCPPPDNTKPYNFKIERHRDKNL
ncbi:MAG: ATP-binding protein [Chloroflexi bacterium]|nr:ATP-binding protein [Chloroflexota bacterium]